MSILYQPKIVCAKELNDYGKIYVVNTTATSAAAIKTDVEALFTTIQIAMGTPGIGIYTILVPSRDYDFYDPITFSFSTNIDNKQLNIIGLTDALSFVSAQVPIQGTSSTGTLVSYINNHIAKIGMSCNGDPSSPAFLTTNISANYPRFIATQLPHQSFLEIKNSVTPAPNQTVLNNSINIIGLEFAPPTGNTDYIFDPTPGNHPNFPDDQNSPGAGVYPAIYVSYMKNIYLDNLNINNLWGSGITINNFINEYTYAYGNTDEVIIQDNLITNVWGKNNYNIPASSGFNIQGIKNGIIQDNKVFNDLDDTKQFASGIGICGGCEFNKDVLTFENEVNGYEFSYWIETSSGGISMVNNRSTGTENGLKMSGNISFSTPTSPYIVARIENNYFSNENLYPSNHFYSAQYPNDNQIEIEARNATNYFTTFKNNKILIDESKFIYYRQNLNATTFDLSPTSNRYSMKNNLPYFENNCNDVEVQSASPISALPGVIHFSAEPLTLGGVLPGWCLKNTYAGLYQSINSCMQIQNNNNINAYLNNAYTVTANAPCGSNSTITDCNKQYDANTTITGTTCTFNLNYTLYDWNICYGVTEGFIGGIAYRVSGGAIPYTFELDGLKTGNGNFSDGTITHLIPGTHTLTIHDNNGCTGSFAFTINGSAGSITGFDHYFANENVNAWTGSNTNKTFLVSQVLTIDQNTTFTNCTFNIAPDAIIKVADGKTLTLVGCTLKNECGLYWQGLEANGANTKIIATGSTFKDMKTGIAISNNAQLDAIGNTFINNLYSSIIFENMNAPSYNGVVKNGNIFTSDNTMLTNSNPSTQGQVGVKIFNSTNINIGDLTDPQSGNTFENLFCGILVDASNNLASIIGANTSNIGLYNNSFSHIQDINIVAPTYPFPEKARIDRAYDIPLVGTNYKGAAIACLYDHVQPPFIPTIEIKNTNAASSSLTTSDCDKAILCKIVSLNASNLYVDNCLMGILDALLEDQSCHIQNNKIYGVAKGIEFTGNNTNSVISGNIISCRQALLEAGISTIGNPGTGTSSLTNYIWPTGISILNYASTISNFLTISNNTIDIPQLAGFGIYSLSNNNSLRITSNTINLNLNTTGNLACGGATLLNGIHATNSPGIQLQDNTVNGNSNCVDAERDDIAAIYLSSTIDATLQCNHLQHTRFGIMAVDNCLTNSDNIKGNTLFDHGLGWLFRRISNEASFGDVGSLTQDNHNTFAGTYAKKVFKFCETLLPFTIFTSSTALPLSQSGSYNTLSSVADNCRYDVQDNTGNATVFDCPYIFNSLTNTEPIPLDEAIAIATDTKEYAAFAEVAHWLDSRRLYTQLCEDSIFRNSDIILLNFYTSMQAEVIHEVNEADRRLRDVLQNASSVNPLLYEQLLEDAENQNEDILPDNVQDENENLVNEIYIRVLHSGSSILNTEDSSFIVTLANTCPFIGGSAVYKARFLNALIAPGTQYDDIKLCNQAGVYKNGGGSSKGLFDDENDFLKSLKPPIKSQNSIFGLVPNPANEGITINYSLLASTAINEFIVYDILGRERMRTILNSQATHTYINTSQLQQGIYICRFLVNNNQVQTTKLMIE
ncbi:MAG: T9SS type A sorting domain-containing protein [Bacteroidetes bacterium]|nr:T9SS type A sorting domain-containing protein [Bacteroidota bacterium]